MSASGAPFGNSYTPTPDWPFPRAPDPPGFFDNLLNPAARDPFAYPVTSPYDMSRPQPGRLSNGYVDLTSPHVDLTAPDTPPRRKRSTASPGPSAKRQKRPDATPPAAIEQIDLSQDDDVLAVLQKQREHAVAAQAKPEEIVAAFNTFNCVICMDRPTDISATACGHLFCHTCLMEALIAGENRAGPGEPRRSQCPVCRKTISRNKATDVIPLLLKKGLASQPRRKAGASAAKTKVQ
ncbi:hypothetical protein C7974DRAFT_414028 [Boeremia exigua]|uniref:uncharacterized protein n=1 Tax=Boeremia exigua TaxID=749465 RepID=UPI001E8CEF1B|nr:uncharacterized protein C7974DRAFT_414028 [Boeremia exigua]KAH6625524.1 hypothetical protein C7974DRAFT_414028 [Boeremia exigua]